MGLHLSRVGVNRNPFNSSVIIMWYKTIFCLFKTIKGEYVLLLYCKKKRKKRTEIFGMGPVYTPKRFRHCELFGSVRMCGSVINSCCKRENNATCKSALYCLWWIELGGNKPDPLFCKVHYKCVLCFLSPERINLGTCTCSMCLYFNVTKWNHQRKLD